MIENIATLLMLIMLQAVLGFDNLLYISLESAKVAKDKQAFVRKLGIGLAIIFRLLLLFILVKAIASFQEPFMTIAENSIFSGSFNVHSLIVLAGGVFIIYTAMKEISHMIQIEEKIESDTSGKQNISLKPKSTIPKSVAKSVVMIIVMNMVFSFDSILSAIALTDVFWVMAAAVVISGVMMIVLADSVAHFLAKNRMYEVLGLFILLIVGVMLLSEGAHLAEIITFGYHIEPMSKSTFYFVIVTMVIVEIIQGKYAKKINPKDRIIEEILAE